MAPKNSNGYVTYRWLFATAMSVLGLTFIATTFVLSAHAERPHKDAISRQDLEAKDKLSDERHRQVIKRLDTIETMLRNR